jgi:hypothetical protein
MLDGIRAFLPGLPFGGSNTPLSDPEEFTREMSSAGFHEVTIHTVTHLVSAPSLSEYSQKAQRSAAPVALLRRKLGEARRGEVAEECACRVASIPRRRRC